MPDKSSYTKPNLATERAQARQRLERLGDPESNDEPYTPNQNMPCQHERLRRVDVAKKRSFRRKRRRKRSWRVVHYAQRSAAELTDEIPPMRRCNHSGGARLGTS